MLIAQSFVWPYLDDFGYASLSYINVIPDVSGTHFNFSEFLAYYRLHYFTITGRVFWQSLTTLILQNLWVARVAQSVVLTALAAAVTYVISKNTKAKPLMIAAVVCCLYGFIEVFVIDKSIYWFSAAVLYVWPLLPLLLLSSSYWQRVFDGREMKKSYFLLLGIGFFFTATAQEQVAVAQSVILIFILSYQAFKTKKAPFGGIVLLLCSVAGFLFVALSPATDAKMELLKYEPSYASMLDLSLVGKITQGYPLALKYIFSKNFYLLVLCMLGCGCWAGAVLLKSRKGVRALNAAAVVLFLLSGTYMLARNTGLYQGALEMGVPAELCTVGATLLILFLVYVFAAYSIHRQKLFAFFAFIAGWAAIFSIMVVYSPVAGRFYVLFAVFSVLFMGTVLLEALSSLKSRKASALVLVCLAAIAAVNVFGYTRQYYFGSSMQEEDDLRLKAVSQAIKNGEDIRSVEVITYPNILSDTWHPDAGTRIIYDDPRTIVAMKEYYDIPQEVEFTWQHRIDPNLPLE